MNAKTLALIATMFAIVAVAIVAVPTDNVDADDTLWMNEPTTVEIGDNTYVVIDFNTPVSSIENVVITGEAGPQQFAAPSLDEGNQSLSLTYHGVLGDNYTIVVSATIDNVPHTAEWPMAATENSIVTINSTNADVTVTGEGVVENADGTYTVPTGNDITLAIAPTIQDIGSVTVNGNAVEPVDEAYTYTTTVSGNITFNVVVTEAVAEEYTVTVNAGENGQATASPESGVAGTPITVNVTPAENYEIDTFTVNGAVVTIENNTYTFELTADTVIDVTFKPVEAPVQQVEVQIDTVENATITVMNGDVQVNDGDLVDVGTTLDVTVVAADGYQVVGQTSYTVEVTVGMSPITATVEPVQTDDPDRPFPNVITLSDGAVIDADSYINAGPSQEVVIAGDVTIIAGGWMNIDGKLTIQEGASLTIENGGWVDVGSTGVVDVQGDLVAEAGSARTTFAYGGIEMTVAGSVTLEGANSFTSTGTGIEISGTFEVGDEASAQFNDATIAQGGELIVYGVVTGAVTNAGTVTVDSQGFEDGTVISMTVNMEADATVDVINVYGTVIVTDAELVFDATRAITDVPAKYDNTVTLTNIAGVTVTETLSIAQDRNDRNTYIGTNTMYVSGNMTYAIDYRAENAAGSVAVAGGNVEMAEDSVLAEGVTLAVNGALKVSADLDATSEAGQVTVNNGGELTVTGKVTTYGGSNGGIVNNGVINAARYATTNPSTTVYTTLEIALDDAATDITLLGKNTVEADATIPVGTTVTMSDGSTLKVAEDATLTVAADDRRSARLTTGNTTDTITVDGTLIVQDMAKSRVVETAILSDTSKEVGDSMTFTNVYNALADAAEGEVVEITRGNGVTVIPVELDADVIVGVGVTLYVPAGQQVDVLNGVTVTVDGTIYAVGAYNLADEVPEDDTTTEIEYKAAGATVVNGMFLYTNGDDYTGAVEHSGQIVGAYFEYSYVFQNSRAETVDAIAPLASVPAIADDVMSETVTLYGTQTLGAIDFSAYDGEGALAGIVIASNVTFDDINLGNVYLTTQGRVSVTGTVTLANGTVELSNVYGFDLRNNVNEVEETTTSVISGDIHAYDNPQTENVKETGSVSFGGEVTSSISVFGDSVVTEGEEQCVSMTVPEGATVSFQTGTYYAPVTVEGSAVITGGTVVFHDLSVTGTVSSEERNVAQAIRLYVGVTSEDYAMAGTGSVSGVRLAAGTGSVAYVSPNATVGTEITEDAQTTAYYVEDELYVTAYANSPNQVDVNIDFTVENAYFMGWQYENTQGRLVDVPATGAYVGGDYDQVYASIDYAIYDVYVTADAGIGTVAIDGIVLPAYGNQFYIEGLTAGQHTISYTLKSGYEGDATLTVNGEQVSGMTFTLAGNPGDDATDADHQVQVTLSLSGSTPVTPGSGDITVNVPSQDDGMGLTDYLLIILVILIIVMAIIVALRLMRS